MTPSRSRLHMATKTCFIKRVSLDLSNGQTSLPDGHIADIPCTPLMARSESNLMGAGRPTPTGADSIQHEIMLFGDYDVKKGDILVLDNVEYSVADKHVWKVADPFILVVLDDVQAAKPLEAEFIR